LRGADEKNERKKARVEKNLPKCPKKVRAGGQALENHPTHFKRNILKSPDETMKNFGNNKLHKRATRSHCAHSCAILREYVFSDIPQD
jgi:hypothetical protein